MTPALSSCQVRCSFRYIQPLATYDTTYELSETVDIVQEVTGEVCHASTIYNVLFCSVLENKYNGIVAKCLDKRFTWLDSYYSTRILEYMNIVFYRNVLTYVPR